MKKLSWSLAILLSGSVWIATHYETREVKCNNNMANMLEHIKIGDIVSPTYLKFKKNHIDRECPKISNHKNLKFYGEVLMENGLIKLAILDNKFSEDYFNDNLQIYYLNKLGLK